MICIRSYGGYLSTGHRVLAFCFLDDVANQEFCFPYYTQNILLSLRMQILCIILFCIFCWSRSSRHFTNFGLSIHTGLEDRRLVTGRKQIEDGDTGPG